MGVFLERGLHPYVPLGRYVVGRHEDFPYFLGDTLDIPQRTVFCDLLHRTVAKEPQRALLVRTLGFTSTKAFLSSTCLVKAMLNKGSMPDEAPPMMLIVPVGAIVVVVAFHGLLPRREYALFVVGEGAPDSASSAEALRDPSSMKAMTLSAALQCLF